MRAGGAQQASPAHEGVRSGGFALNNDEGRPAAATPAGTQKREKMQGESSNERWTTVDGGHTERTRVATGSTPASHQASNAPGFGRGRNAQLDTYSTFQSNEKIKVITDMNQENNNSNKYFNGARSSKKHITVEKSNSGAWEGQSPTKSS